MPRPSAPESIPMIVVQTPLRISFFGGGTDLPAFSDIEGGCVLSSAIDRYIYVIIKERYDERIRVGYSRTELVDSVQDLEHELVRESLRMTGLSSGIEISTMADIPSRGSGLGSSSAVTIGLLNAMYHFRSEPCDRETLARQACEIEIGILGKPIGKQDQYIAAYGGQRLIEFKPCGGVQVSSPQVDRDVWRRLSERLLLFFTGITRKADTVLQEQEQNVPERMSFLREIKKMATQGWETLAANELDEFGRLLNQGWALKKQLASGFRMQPSTRCIARRCTPARWAARSPGRAGEAFSCSMHVPNVTTPFVMPSETSPSCGSSSSPREAKSF